MENIALLLKNREFDMQKAQDFGFIKTSEGWIYSRPLSEPGFEFQVTLKEQEPSVRIMETQTGEVYAPALLPTPAGTFAARLKSQSMEILKEIIEKCSFLKVFMNPFIQSLIRYAEETYGEKPEFLWKQFPTNAILRRKDNKKWYAAFLTVSPNKLKASEGMPKNETKSGSKEQNDPAEIIDFRIEEEKLPGLLDGRKYFPAWHMNKKHWITVLPGESASFEEVRLLLENSRLLAAQTQTKTKSKKETRKKKRHA